MKRVFLTIGLLLACHPALAQDAQTSAALKSMGPTLCETMRTLNDPDTAAALPPRIDVPVSADDLKRYGANTNGQPMTVSFLKGGHVLVNEQDITPAIQSFCGPMGGTTAAPQSPSSSTLTIPGMQ